MPAPGSAYDDLAGDPRPGADVRRVGAAGALVGAAAEVAEHVEPDAEVGVGQAGEVVGRGVAERAAGLPDVRRWQRVRRVHRGGHEGQAVGAVPPYW